VQIQVKSNKNVFNKTTDRSQLHSVEKHEIQKGIVSNFDKATQA